MDLNLDWLDEDTPREIAAAKLPPEKPITDDIPLLIRAGNREFNRKRTLAISRALTSDEDVVAIFNKLLSQVVTVKGVEVGARRSATEMAARHLRSQINKAIARCQEDPEMVPVHPEWVEDQDAFEADAGPRPSLEHTFGMLDPELGFVPGNAQWLTRTQVLARMGRRMVSYEGETLTLARLAQRTGVPLTTIRNRWEAGHRDAELWAPGHFGTKYVATIGDKQYTLRELADRTGIHINTLRTRMTAIRQGVQGVDLLALEDKRNGKPLRAKKGK